MRTLALRWLWWAFVWDITRYCALNPWRIFVALPLWLTGVVTVLLASPELWREKLYWNIGQCWDAIESGDVTRPGEWLAQRLDPSTYRQLQE